MQYTKLQEKNDRQQVLSQNKYRELQEFIDRLEEKEGSLIHVLHKAQEIFGYLPRDLQLYIARALGLSGAKVYGVVSFYNYFTDKPRGEKLINICTGTACFVKGANRLMEYLEDKLKIKAGGTTEDGKYTLNGVRCVGACGLAPVVMVDEKVYGRVKLEELDAILNQY
jgi:NADH-quinone oxidoreductase subunit E/NADP-reducing hydrogenase subunit HndA